MLGALPGALLTSGLSKQAFTTAAFRLSTTTRLGTPPNHSKACRCNNSQVDSFWSKTNSTSGAVPPQRHHECPSLPILPTLRVLQQASRAKIDLDFLARATLDPYEDLRCGRFQTVYEATYGRVTALVAALV